MRNNIWNKRIPTLLSILLIIVATAITSFLVKTGVIFVSKAGPSQIPQDTRITNVSDTSFTVNYTTEDNVIGSINFGKDKTLGQNGLDQRDQTTNSVSFHRIHSITITNLEPSTNYFFSIISGQNTFLNNDQPFQVSTAPTIQATPSSQTPIVGNVILPNGEKPSEAIVYATIDGAQTISTLVKSDGSYILPLNSLRTNDFSSYFNFNKNTIIKMLLVGNSLKANVLLSNNQVNPVPTITLSKDYDFTISQEPVASESAQVSSSFPSILVSTQSALKTQVPQILTPKKDEGFSDQQPLFKGTAQPNQTVKIIIHSAENIQSNVTTDASGNWSYRPNQPLSPGEHTVTIQTKDSSGIIKTITQSFIVYASGAKTTDIISPTPTIAPTATPSPSLSPIPTLTPTPTIAIPTLTPIPTRVPSLKPTQTLPPSGSNNIFLGIVGIGIAIFGFVLFFVSRKGVTPL